MVRNIVVLGGLSHPGLTETICEMLGVQQGQALFSKFAVGETRVEIGESVRGKDVYIIQSGGGKVNDHLVELLIAISACKTASAKKVTAVLPLFPYSRQSDIPYNKTGAPLVKGSSMSSKPESNGYTFDSIPSTPHPDKGESPGLANGHPLHKAASRSDLDGGEHNPTHQARFSHYRDSSASFYCLTFNFCLWQRSHALTTRPPRKELSDCIAQVSRVHEEGGTCLRKICHPMSM